MSTAKSSTFCNIRSYANRHRVQYILPQRLLFFFEEHLNQVPKIFHYDYPRGVPDQLSMSETLEILHWKQNVYSFPWDLNFKISAGQIHGSCKAYDSLPVEIMPQGGWLGVGQLFSAASQAVRDRQNHEPDQVFSILRHMYIPTWDRVSTPYSVVNPQSIQRRKKDVKTRDGLQLRLGNWSA
jgi:hypothetical protein